MFEFLPEETVIKIFSIYECYIPIFAQVCKSFNHISDIYVDNTDKIYSVTNKQVVEDILQTNGSTELVEFIKSISWLVWNKILDRVDRVNNIDALKKIYHKFYLNYSLRPLIKYAIRTTDTEVLEMIANINNKQIMISLEDLCCVFSSKKCVLPAQALEKLLASDNLYLYHEYIEKIDLIMIKNLYYLIKGTHALIQSHEIPVVLRLLRDYRRYLIKCLPNESLIYIIQCYISYKLEVESIAVWIMENRIYDEKLFEILGQHCNLETITKKLARYRDVNTIRYVYSRGIRNITPYQFCDLGYQTHFNGIDDYDWIRKHILVIPEQLNFGIYTPISFFVYYSTLGNPEFSIHLCNLYEIVLNKKYSCLDKVKLIKNSERSISITTEEIDICIRYTNIMDPQSLQSFHKQAMKVAILEGNYRKFKNYYDSAKNYDISQTHYNLLTLASSKKFIRDAIRNSLKVPTIILLKCIDMFYKKVKRAQLKCTFNIVSCRKIEICEFFCNGKCIYADSVCTIINSQEFTETYEYKRSSEMVKEISNILMKIK